MASTKQRANTEAVYAQVRADVLGGVHQPGERLKFSALCERYGASVSVVREALSRLAEQGLVVSEPRIGFAVRAMTVDDLRDLTMTRIEVETLALRKAIERGDVDWESQIVAAHHRLERTGMFTDDAPPRVSDDWESAHSAFHGALLSGCASHWLLGIATTLRDAAEFYRRWSQIVEPGRDAAGEHRRILDAALARDADLAAERLREHYQRTADIVERGLTERDA
ncbi:FCD domain-containing protein [Flexivirga sp. ID2601S]|uniref:FCD domain-containing protein n=1 Tax=Flexivirga aerilata TaxID=1656889 RepID=A0A849AJQ1_9MICO|nr:FCD domain-containing protein [Flexivirga aerilata]NNG40645.1 FCD domain-containing protein [Flexivirga aerilata]